MVGAAQDKDAPVPLKHTLVVLLAGELNALQPGGVAAVQPKRILGRVVVEVPVVVVLEQTVELSARYHLDQVPVPSPVVVH